MTATILIGDCREQLFYMADESVHCCVTSPPYFGLRDYGVGGQIGLEKTPDEYVAELVAIFREVRRVLRSDGTLWLNLGDSYSSTTKGSGGAGKSTLGPNRDLQNIGFQKMEPRRFDMASAGLKAKDLIGIPWLVAFALRADGWYLRQEIIWHKPNVMPESVKDRCTKAHEQIFLLSKSPRYYFDADAIKEPAVNTRMPGRKVKQTDHYGAANGGNAGLSGVLARYHETGLPTHRNRRSVWTVPPKPFKGAHFATFPTDLIEPCVLAGCPEKCCSKCGAPVVDTFEKTGVERADFKGSTFDKGKTGARDGGDRTQPGPRFTSVKTGSKPSCDCGAPLIGGTVLDPFGGAGTTGLVAEKLKRNSVLIELNPEYAAMAQKRIHPETPLFEAAQ